jgi:acetyl esterase/lipase
MSVVARFVFCALFSVLASYSQDGSAREVVRLWPGAAPGSEDWPQKEVKFSWSNGEAIRNVVDPALTVFPAPKSSATGTAVIVCPGGGFQVLSWQMEGTEVASWLNERGITAFVLKYRLADTGESDATFNRAMNTLIQGIVADPEQGLAALAGPRAVAAADGQRAVQVVRENAAKWGIAPHRIGMLGFSAGAAVSMDVAASPENAGLPDFVASIYGPSLRTAQVGSNAPPIFIACAADDRLTPFRLNLDVYSAWKKAGRQAELHIFDKGGHGFGIRKRGLPADRWIDLFHSWLVQQGF